MNGTHRFFGTSATAHAAVSLALMAAVLGAVFMLSGPDALAVALSQLNVATVTLIALLLAAGVGLSSLRLKWIASSLGYELSLRDAVMALTVGQIAGSLFFQFFGQLIGRSVVLAGRGVPPAASVVLFGYERIFALLVSLSLAVAGALYLFGSIQIDLQRGGLSLLQVFVGMAVAILAGAALAWGRQAYRLWVGLTATFSARLGWSGVLSFGVQLTTLAAYVIAGRTLAPNVDFVSLVAASCIIMFAAALPISFAGWGLRELSAVVVLQAIGFSNAAALVAGLSIGVISLLVLAASALAFQFLMKPNPPLLPVPAAAETPDYTMALDWVLPIAAATAVFFQIYIPTGRGELNVNLADPVALIGCALYILRHIRTGGPNWRVPKLELYLIAATLVIVLSFVHGVLVFGFTSWAFANRAVGWGMLLCYAATGALIVDRARDEGYEVLIKTFAATGVAVSALNTGILAVSRLGSESVQTVDLRIAGFSQNPNAFAFILLMTLAAVVALRRSALRTAMATCVLTGLWYTGSRAGVGAGLVMLIAAIALGTRLRDVALAVGLWALTVLLIKFLPAIAGGLFHFDLSAAMPWKERAFSDVEHFASMRLGLSMFFAHPIFGAGLGAFMNERLNETGTALVIHSTPIWLLAETGVVGFAVFFFTAFKIARSEYGRRQDPVAVTLLLILCGLAAMSSIHELLYQRSFWLLLGAALAFPVSLSLKAKPAALR